MRTVPDVPNLPLLDVRPKGILLASSRPAAPVSLADTEWVQTSAGSEADFLPGGYKRNAIVFDGDGTVEVTRSYIGDGEILRKWRIGGQLDLAKGNLELGQDQDRRPADSSLKGQDLREMDSSVVPATTGLPVKLKVRRVSQDMMELDGKTYRRVSPKR